MGSLANPSYDNPQVNLRPIGIQTIGEAGDPVYQTK